MRRFLAPFLATILVCRYLCVPDVAVAKPQVTFHLLPSSHRTMSYPTTSKSNQVDDYHGTLVADPYRWLENPDSPEIKAWIEAQNKVTFGYLQQIPVREKSSSVLLNFGIMKSIAFLLKRAIATFILRMMVCKTKVYFIL